MKKNIKFLIIVLILCGIYACFLLYTKKYDQKNTNAPVINMNSSSIEISVQDGESALLKGITVSDEEDGNITKSLFIQDISAYNENMERTVTYAVFDSDDNLATASRTVKYVDYTAPAFNIIYPLVSSYYVDSTNLLKCVTANSCVDGDITSEVVIDQDETDASGIRTVTYSVTDSCGTKSSLSVKFTQLVTQTSYDIQLTGYLLDVPVGTYVNPYEYIVSISENGMDMSYLISNITIDTDYNPYVPGTYEYIYRLDYAGEIGYTKLVVRVM